MSRTLGRPFLMRGSGAVALTLIGLPFIGSPPSSADDHIGVAITSATNMQIQFSICIDDPRLLPAHIDASYALDENGTTVAAATWSNSRPDSTLISVQGCPYPYLIFAVNGLDDGTTYTVNAIVTFTPKVSDGNGDMVDDTTRAIVTAHAAATATTTTSPFDPDEPASTTNDTSATAPSPTTAGTSASATVGAIEAYPDASVGESTPEIDPAAFDARDLSALSPRAVAAIPPAILGRLSPRTLRGLRPAQAAQLSAAQVSSIRPARARQLRPATLAAIPVEAISSLRSASVRRLRVAALTRLSLDHLSALSLAQVDALTPNQLAHLSPLQRSALRTP